MRTSRPLPGRGLGLAPGSSFTGREVDSRNGSVAGADAEWPSGASVLETWHGQKAIVQNGRVVRREIGRIAYDGILRIYIHIPRRVRELIGVCLQSLRCGDTHHDGVL